MKILKGVPSCCNSIRNTTINGNISLNERECFCLSSFTPYEAVELRLGENKGVAVRSRGEGERGGEKGAPCMYIQIADGMILDVIEKIAHPRGERVGKER